MSAFWLSLTGGLGALGLIALGWWLRGQYEQVDRQIQAAHAEWERLAQRWPTHPKL